ncbi:AMP-binding domain protein [Hyaloraphidium curvatum]|nr:AMP-binding domain protein [Hyaloraphidium curvatum]
MPHVALPHSSQPAIGDYFEAIVDKYGDRTGLVCKAEGNLRWTYREYDENVNALAKGLHALGLRKGDRVGVYMPNNSAYASLQYATAKLGLILVTINPAFRGPELENALRHVGCRALFIQPHFKTTDYISMLTSLAPELISCQPGALMNERMPDLRTVVMWDHSELGYDWKTAPKGVLRYDDILHFEAMAKDPIKSAKKYLSNRDIVNLQFTSGTTGRPKGVSLSHRNLINNGYIIGENMQLTPEDKVVIPVPLFHCFGLVLGALAAMTHGSANIFPAQGFDALATLRAVHEEKATACHGVPTMWVEMLNRPEFSQLDLSKLRTGIMAGSVCPMEVMTQVRDKMNVRDITICYGMTETSPVSFQTGLDSPIQKRVETVGRVVPHVDAKIIDPATGESVPVNTPGELLSRGYIVMEGGYWGEPEQTAKAVDPEGYMHTGDLAVMDEEGYVRIVGRLKDLIIRGGENIAPTDIENAIFPHPQVANVTVVGVPDERLGEAICAWIIPKPGVRTGMAHSDDPEVLTPDSIREFLRERIAHYKIPRYFSFVDSFPLTPSGKIKKHEVRDAAIQNLQVVKTHIEQH